jgi:hypothetical protein
MQNTKAAAHGTWMTSEKDKKKHLNTQTDT